jgi:hypothetical protein
MVVLDDVEAVDSVKLFTNSIIESCNNVGFVEISLKTRSSSSSPSEAEDSARSRVEPKNSPSIRPVVECSGIVMFVGTDCGDVVDKGCMEGGVATGAGKGLRGVLT